MQVSFKKSDIKSANLFENASSVSFMKNELRLNEDNEDTAYASSMSDLSDASHDSHTGDVVINKANTDNNPTTDATTIDVEADNVNDASNKIKMQNNNPNVKKLGDNVNYKVHLKSSVEPKTVMDEVRLTKSELSKMLK